MEKTRHNPVIITQYKWAGHWGPLRIQSRCGECDLVTTILRGMMEKEFKNMAVVLEVKPWLDNMFYCLRRGAWHPPIIMVNGAFFFQFSHKRPLFDKNKLIQTVSGLLEMR